MAMSLFILYLLFGIYKLHISILFFYITLSGLVLLIHYFFVNSLKLLTLDIFLNKDCHTSQIKGVWKMLYPQVMFPLFFYYLILMINE